ncbi:MAG: hypothetical protein J0G33_05495 [Afipia felis]|uniref:Uncharacterized protein n=3 Tax=Afipia felis TaxID=1035 RepID=A0A090MPG0_AFIFE|nr:hypothetical protein HMPREF9697_00939 [Afipia felis ATCC 53690]MBE0704739.1 hypothetical protein [Afipia sp.]MBN9602369.1 hypothetical protein [Afipia felis]RTL61686.1 MAG: hypothetical protein EKK42_34190 [Pseudonocardiaceae bacterium]CEG09246.1 hypothetical protein BN961_02669 [Afipia felis]
MCPPDRANEEPDERDASEGSGSSTNAAQEKNNVVGPLTDEEMQIGGMDRVVAYIRTKRSKEALRKEKQRKKQHANGTRQINLDVPNNDRSRATMRRAAIAIKDEVSHQALEVLLANERLRPLIVGLAARPELHEIVDLIQQRPATPNSLNAARLVITDPAIAELVDRATTTSRVREALELAAANPEFVFFGRNAATGRSLCARLARLLLRIRKVRHVENAP